MPAPTSLSSGACSWTSTSRPRLSSDSAAARPPMPPPMMTIFFRHELSASFRVRHADRRFCAVRMQAPALTWIPDPCLAFGFRNDAGEVTRTSRRLPSRSRPSAAFPRDERREILRRADLGVEAELGHAFLHLRRTERLVDRGVELADDVGGVPAGASTPAQNSSVSSGSPASRAVGTSGSSAMRAGLVMASGRILPSRMSGIDVEGVGFSIWMRPPRKSGSAAAPPL